MKHVVAVIGMLLLAGCAGSIRQPDPPDDLIGRDSMVTVLKDLVVLESYLQTNYQHVNRYYKVMTASGKICLKKYHITPDRFERSYNYYVSRQPELQGIYAEVLDSLNKEVTEMGLEASKADDTTLVAPM